MENETDRGDGEEIRGRGGKCLPMHVCLSEVCRAPVAQRDSEATTRTHTHAHNAPVGVFTWQSHVSCITWILSVIIFFACLDLHTQLKRHDVCENLMVSPFSCWRVNGCWTFSI